MTVKILKSKKKSWHLPGFIMLVEKYAWSIQNNLFSLTNQGSIFSQNIEFKNV